jgi:hypothetical protein
MSKPKHPMQEIAFDERGTIRFRENAIVRLLVDEANARGDMFLNRIHMMQFDEEDRIQFAQLIGYSVSGYGDLDYGPKHRRSVRKADRRAAKLVR